MSDGDQDATSPGNRMLVLTRIFDAPRELVWKVWTDPTHFARWFGTPPVTAPVSAISMDVRPGGEWRATMISEVDGTTHPFVGIYREVEEPRRLVFTLDNPQDRSDPKVEVVTVTFTERDGKTEMTFQQVGHLPEEVYATGLKHGWGGFFDRLSAHLAEVS
jgi:uncharacterized protein YndB with AHSA1/START domain